MLETVVDSVRGRHEYLAETDLTTQVAAAARKTGETLAADADVDPEPLAELLTTAVAADTVADSLDALSPSEESGEPTMLADAIQQLADREGATVSLPDDDWPRLVTEFIEALKHEFVASEATEGEAATSLQSLGATALQYGDFDTAEKYLELSQAVAQELDDSAAEASTLTSLGDGALRSGNPDVAGEYYRQSLDLARGIEDKALEATSLAGLGNAAFQQNELEAAEEFHRKGLDIRRELDDRSTEANSLASLGSVAGSREEFDSAEAYLGESLDLKRLAGDTAGEATTLASLGTVAESRGDYDTATERYTEALELFTSTDQLRERLQALQGLAAVELERGNEEQALKHCEEGLRLIAESDLVDEAEQHQWFRTTRGKLTGSHEDIEAAYETALEHISEDDDPAAFDLLRNVWDCRQAFEAGSVGHAIALRAGVAFAAYHLLLDSEEIDSSREPITDEIDQHSDALSEPAAVLFEFVRSEGTDRDLTISTDGLSEDDSSVDARERRIYAAFLSRISGTPEPSKLYTSALTGIVSDERELSEIVDLCLMTWEQRDDDAADLSRPVLGAGLVAEAYRECFDIRLPTDQQNVFDTIADHRSGLSEPLAALFDRLATGSTDTTADALLDAADEDEPTVTDVERMAIARFLEQLDG